MWPLPHPCTRPPRSQTYVLRCPAALTRVAVACGVARLRRSAWIVFESADSAAVAKKKLDFENVPLSAGPGDMARLLDMVKEGARWRCCALYAIALPTRRVPFLSLSLGRTTAAHGEACWRGGVEAGTGYVSSTAALCLSSCLSSPPRCCRSLYLQLA
jgi:hypothetical protein